VCADDYESFIKVDDLFFVQLNLRELKKTAREKDRD
jgi:hypothetical protein